MPYEVSKSEICVKGEEKTAFCKVSLESSKRHRLNRQIKLGGKKEHRE